MSARIIDIAGAIRSLRYADAGAVFAAGSIVRGEGTPFSDLDLVIVYPQLERAYRESFRFDGLPVEAFVHDPATLEYFFTEVDRPTGIPDAIHTGGRAVGKKQNWLGKKECWRYPVLTRSEGLRLPSRVWRTKFITPNKDHSSSLLSAILSWNCDPS